MIQLSTTLVAVFAELSGAVLLAALFFGYRLASRRRVDRKAALAVAGEIKEGVPARLEALRKTLAEDLGYGEEALDEGARRISHRERSLYQRILNLYVKRDAAALRQITIDVENHTAACLGLLPSIAVAPPGDGPGPAGDDSGLESEVAALRDENERLQEELRITMETMSRMLDEYSTMFGGGDPDMEMGGTGDPGFAEMDVEEGVERGEGPSSEADEVLIDAAAEGADADGFEMDEEVPAGEEPPPVVVEPAAEAAEPAPDPVPASSPEPEPLSGSASEAAVTPPEPEAEELDDIWAEALAEQEQKEAEMAR